MGMLFLVIVVAIVFPICTNSNQNIQNFQVQSSENNTVTIILTFFGNSSARGALLALLYIVPEGLNFTLSRFLILNRQQAPSINIMLYNISAGIYTTLAYDIEEDGYLRYIEPAEKVEDVEVNGQQMLQLSEPLPPYPGFEGCLIMPSEDGQSIDSSCSFGSTMVDYYQVTVHYASSGFIKSGSAAVNRSITVAGSGNGVHHVVARPVVTNSSDPGIIIFRTDVDLTRYFGAGSTATSGPFTSNSTFMTTTAADKKISSSTLIIILTAVIIVFVAFLITTILAFVTLYIISKKSRDGSFTPMCILFKKLPRKKTRSTVTKQ